MAGRSPSELVPEWNDEWWWWQQANAIAEYGRPLGYWGYQGNHAPFGTFAAWGPAAALPFGFYAAVFGWQLHSYIYANLFFSVTSILIFILLSEIDEKGLLFLLAVNCGQFILLSYMGTAMAETSRWSIGLVAVGSLIYLWHHRENVKWFVAYLIIPIWLLYATQAYIPYGSLFFAWFLYLHRRQGKGKYIMAGLETGILIVLSRALWDLMACAYPYREEHSFLGYIKYNILELIHWLLHGESEKFHRAFFLGYLFFCLFLLVYLCVRYSKHKALDLFQTSAFALLLAFMMGFIISYTTTPTSFTRGIAIAWLLAGGLLCCSEDRRPLLLMLLCICISLPWAKETYEICYEEERFRTAEWNETNAELFEITKELLIPNPQTDDPWDNTVEVYNEENLRITLALPAGFSANMCKDSAVGLARWAMLDKEKKPEENEKICAELLEKKYEIQYENEAFVIFWRATG